LAAGGVGRRTSEYNWFLTIKRILHRFAFLVVRPSNRASNGIVWAIEPFVGPRVLHAYDASDVSKELYNRKQNAKRDIAGTQQKYSVPTIANGKAYVGTQTELDVYGQMQLAFCRWHSL
jgi:hypothetical protein